MNPMRKLQFSVIVFCLLLILLLYAALAQATTTTTSVRSGWPWFKLPTVDTVNGVAPDSTGNVVLEIAGEFDNSSIVSALSGKASLTSPLAGTDNVTRDKRLLVITGTDNQTLINRLAAAAAAGKASLTSPVAGSDNVTRDKRLLAIADTDNQTLINRLAAAAAAGKLNTLYVINKPTTKVYTFVLTDATTNTLVMADNASAQTYTVPGTTAVAIPIGSQLNVEQSGAGKLTFAGAGGVKINSLSGNKAVGGQRVAINLIKTDNSTWSLYGNLQP